ncbi:hypothetical protein [Candidatus Ruminimicrobium bovinum]|uniref:hypothetical protein n=1 Tax=Candidatus Ruminimicrobium bovinum TaxID=3242779 RepID=UPI0039B971B8
MKNKKSQKIIDERKQIIANVQFENVIKNNKAKIGRKFEAFVESIDKNKAYCRTEFQAPEIDGITIVNLKNKKINPGQFIKTTVSNFKNYDLIGRLEN